MPSAEFEALKLRLDHLVGTLPAERVIPGSWSNTEMDQIAFFAVMSSAACEHYMEKRCVEVADDALARFNANGHLGRAGKHICVMPFLQVPTDDKDATALYDVVGNPSFGVEILPALAAAQPRVLATLIDRGHRRYKRLVKDNHGISRKFYFKILATVGIDTNGFGPNFVSSVDGLWALRGRAAHSVVVAAQVVTPISTMQQWITDIIAGMNALDTSFDTLKTTAL